ncbi:MAG TPA: protein kinase [Planctomycetaceae bacterium]|jgi:serine/threonine protein kinase
MNVYLRTDACDPDRLESFLKGKLSAPQEREFTLHLNSCENCRRSLERRAAEPEAWREAETLLKPTQFDSLDADELSDSVMAQPGARQPLQIQSVLDALGPTDDPQMLGRLGGYEVSGVVGSGAMGIVLKAIDKSLDRTVAIKVLAPHLASSGAARKRFAREAKAAAAVLHPNVIAIHSVSNDESLPYLVMPYVRGTSLQRRLDTEGPLSLREILRIGSQIAAGLAAAHAQGLVHRDIKPANILLEEGVERVAITDFGLARAVDDATITHSGVIAGTPQYMSPEQARGETVEQCSDLFSLGSVLYAICTGRPPFRAETTYGVMRRITDDEPAPIREINPDIPDWLCAIIARLISKRPSERFRSAAEVTELLETCLAHVQQPARVPLPASVLISARSSATRSTIFGFKRVGFKKVLALIALLGIGLLGFTLLTAVPPDISGEWTSEEWGHVVLKKTSAAEYAGTYDDTFGKQPGEIRLKWSRIERRFNGSWREGDDRFGELSVRLVGNEIRGAHTTDPKSKINPATPRLADLNWTRFKATVETGVKTGATDERAKSAKAGAGNNPNVAESSSTLPAKSQSLASNDGSRVAGGVTPATELTVTSIFVFSDKNGLFPVNERALVKFLDDTFVADHPERDGFPDGAVGLESKLVDSRLSRLASLGFIQINTPWNVELKESELVRLDLVHTRRLPDRSHVRLEVTPWELRKDFDQQGRERVHLLRDMNGDDKAEVSFLLEEGQSVILPWHFGSREVREAFRKEYGGETFVIIRPIGNSASVSRTFPLRFKLASDMADDLRQILLGRPGHEAKPSDNNLEIAVTAPPEVMKRVQTFIMVMDWPESITRQSNYEYPRETVLRAARSFFYACAIEDADEVFSKMLSPGVLGELKGDTKSEHYFDYNTGGTPDPDWEKSLRADWPGKKEAIQRFVREWNRYPLKRITGSGGVAIGFGVKHFCSVSFDDAPKEFYEIIIEPERKPRDAGKESFFFSSLPPWWKADEK